MKTKVPHHTPSQATTQLRVQLVAVIIIIWSSTRKLIKQKCQKVTEFLHTIPFLVNTHTHTSMDIHKHRTPCKEIMTSLNIAKLRIEVNTSIPILSIYPDIDNPEGKKSYTTSRMNTRTLLRAQHTVHMPQQKATQVQ